MSTNINQRLLPVRFAFILIPAVALFTLAVASITGTGDYSTLKHAASLSNIVLIVFCSGSFFVLHQYVRRRLLSSLKQ